MIYYYFKFFKLYNDDTSIKTSIFSIVYALTNSHYVNSLIINNENIWEYTISELV